MNRRAITGKPGRTSLPDRRSAPKRGSRAYVFVRRGKKRRKEAAPGLSRRQKIVAAAASLLVLAVLSYCSLIRPPFLQRPLYTAEKSEESEPGRRSADSPYFRFLQLILGCEMPGLEPPALTGDRQIYGAVCMISRCLTGIDPRDPCTMLELELGADPRLSLPVHCPPSADAPEGGEPGSPALSADPAAPPWGGALFPFPAADYGEAPILLYHTHASEAFTASPGDLSSFGGTVVTVGEELARLLEEGYGLQVLHHRDVYDLPRRYAYSKARPVIERIIAENSGLQVVVDLHRDGVPRAKTTAKLGGKEYARLLLVVGTHNPGHLENLSFALRLQSELEAVLPGLSRGIFQQDFTYNQDLHPYAVLVEVGGHENSIDEALLSLPYLAEALARTYYIFFMQD